MNVGIGRMIDLSVGYEVIFYFDVWVRNSGCILWKICNIVWDGIVLWLFEKFKLFYLKMDVVVVIY